MHLSSTLSTRQAIEEGDHLPWKDVPVPMDVQDAATYIWQHLELKVSAKIYPFAGIIHRVLTKQINDTQLNNHHPHLSPQRQQ